MTTTTIMQNQLIATDGTLYAYDAIAKHLTIHHSETTHPAILAYHAGNSLTYDAGADYTAYLVVLSGTEYIVTVWTDGEIGVQAV